jgi:hypothetical protein
LSRNIDSRDDDVTAVALGRWLGITERMVRELANEKIAARWQVFVPLHPRDARVGEAARAENGLATPGTGLAG